MGITFENGVLKIGGDKEKKVGEKDSISEVFAKEAKLKKELEEITKKLEELELERVKKEQERIDKIVPKTNDPLLGDMNRTIEHYLQQEIEELKRIREKLEEFQKRFEKK
jgi:hypothetical protein